MQTVEIIRKKRDGKRLSPEELGFLVKGIACGEISEAQTGAFLMACYFQGLSKEETSALALEMAHSGEMLDLSSIPGTVDKHSTGGVGDKTTMVVAPLAAAAGVPVPKLSGRALGHTSGTIDRLEAIPKFRTDLGREQFLEQVKRIGVAIGGQTADLVPADKKMYALRDITATVEVIPLIAASVMSKKLAGGAAGIVLDVKCGRGAFVQELAKAKELAEAMVEIGQAAGRRTRALITAMEQPLGRAIGEGIETWEAIETLHGRGPADFVELCLLLASHMIHVGGGAETPEAAAKAAEALLKNGAAQDKFRQMVTAQGGDEGVVENPQPLAASNHTAELKAAGDGFVAEIDARIVGETARSLISKHRGGILLERKVGDKVTKGETLGQVLSDQEALLEAALSQLESAYTIATEAPKPVALLLCSPIG